MLELNFFTSSDKYGVIKATVHRTGKLGFSSGAAKYMELDKKSFFLIGTSGNDHSLYLVPTNEESDNSFKLVKAGEYYYIFIKNVLLDLKLDYKNESIIYDISEEEYKEDNIFKLTRRKK